MKNVHKILLIGHYYLEICYLFENLWSHPENFSLKKVKLFIRLFLSIRKLSCVFSKGSKFFVAEEKSGLHKRELLKYHEKFPILVFEGSLSIEMA